MLLLRQRLLGQRELGRQLRLRQLERLQLRLWLRQLRLWLRQLQLRLQLQLQLQQLQRQLLLNAGRTGRGSASFSAPRRGQALYFLRPDRRTWTKNSGSFIMRPRRRGSLHSR